MARALLPAAQVKGWPAMLFDPPGMVAKMLVAQLSKNEQQKRFLERIDEPDKNWKFSLADIHKRKYWKHYMEAYEDCFNSTSNQFNGLKVWPAGEKKEATMPPQVTNTINE